jgi:peptide/nickel transport system substrate-binding protein
MSSIPHRMRLAAVLVAGTLAVAGCGSSSSDSGAKKPSSGDTLSKAQIFASGFTGSGDDSGTPKQGGQLTIADYGEPRSLDPTVTYANGATGGSAMAAIYDELVRYDYTTQKYVPELAESLTSPDNTVWTLKLRDGVTFTNGQPLDAAAVLASLKYYESKYGFQSNLLLANVASTATPDSSTVVFTLRSPWSGFPNMLAQGPGMIMAPAAYANPKAFKPIGAGPFTYGSYAPGESLVLNANPDYVGGKPYLDSLKFVWIGGTDDQAKVDALKSGTADTAYLRDPEVITKERKAKADGMMFGIGMADDVWINTRSGHPGSDLLVRQAITNAIDVDSYVDRVSNGTGLATKGLFGAGSAWYTAATAQYDTTKAKDLLKQAEAKGFDGKIGFTYSASPAAQTGAVMIKAMLEAVGFKVTLVPLRSVADQVQKLYVDHDFDLAVAATSLPDVDPYSRLASTFAAQSPSNLAGWSSPDMDKLLAELQAKDSPAEGKSVMAQIQQLFQDQVPGINIDAGGVYQVWNSDVHGVEPNTETMLLYAKAWKG